MKITRFQFMLGTFATIIGCRRSKADDDIGKWMKEASGHLDNISSRFMYARLAIAPEMKRKFIGYSGCERCQLPWPLVLGHSTWFRENEFGGDGYSPLCVDCWIELSSPANRWPYYESSWNRSQSGLIRKDDLQLIRKAVWAEPQSQPPINQFRLMLKNEGVK